MTQDEIIEMAKECGLVGMRPHLDGIYFEALEAFAKLVAQHEREACAKDLDKVSEAAKDVDQQGFVWRAVKESADAIRARGQA